MQSFDAVREAGTAHLRACGDIVMAGIVEQVGACTFQPTYTEYYQTLVDSIVSQQISGKAASSIMRKLSALFADNMPEPSAMLALSDEELRGAGISPQKLRYLRDLSQHVVDGRLDLAALPDLPDEEIITRLVAVKGIGRWTAEMFLMFCLGRPDILPVDDLGIRNAIQRNYKLPGAPGKAEMLTIGAPWRPYATIASWYLWRSLSLPQLPVTEVAP